MNILRIAFVLPLLFLITACSPPNGNDDTNKTIETKGSYEALLFVNGQEFQSVGEKADELELVVGELIGVIKEKTNIETRPSVEFTSNYLEAGTEIYSVEGNNKIVLAKKNNGEYEVFE